MKKERLKEIKAMFSGRDFISVTDSGFIKIVLYPIKYDTKGLSKFIALLSAIEKLPEYNTAGFDTYVNMGYYEDVEDIYLEFAPNTKVEK